MLDTDTFGLQAPNRTPTESPDEVDFTGIMSAQYAQNKHMSKYHGREKSKNRTAKIRAMSCVGSR